MRTVISHFYNEEYLLPWWLKHHVAMFDHGIMINHGSTDNSVDIVRQIAPHWHLVNTTLTDFDAFMTDLEVMNYEKNVPGWKIALNVTEFLMPTVSLDIIENQLTSWKRKGCSCSGFICIDPEPSDLPLHQYPLPLQKPWGIDDNSVLDEDVRLKIGLSSAPLRNRFYHCNPTGMYLPGRHSSHHQDSLGRLTDLMIFHFGFSPWNPQARSRKTQMAHRIPKGDTQRGWSPHHLVQEDVWDTAFSLIRSHAQDLHAHPKASIALKRLAY